MSNSTVVIAAGGTGGHVFPALAVARELLARNVPVVWVGNETGLEYRVVPESGIPLRTIGASPLRGGGILRKPIGLYNLIRAIVRSLTIVRQENAGTVLGMGGYVAGPVCLAAKISGRRLVVHEQNAVPGFTNKILKCIASRVLEAIPNTFAASHKVTHTGNPVRQELLAVDEPGNRYHRRADALRILVVGGSQGARALNQKVPAALALLNDPVSVIHQCGSRWLEETEASYKNVAHNSDVREFIDDMAEVYSWADVIICRSGAMTVAEISAVGLASILIPFPAAVDDHQTANGAFLVDANAALMFQESDLTAEALASQLQKLDRDTLQSMAVNARMVSRRDATNRVVAELTGLTS